MCECPEGDWVTAVSGLYLLSNAILEYNTVIKSEFRPFVLFSVFKFSNNGISKIPLSKHWNIVKFIKGIRGCSVDLTNLNPKSDYKFRVRVENKYGVSEPSPYVATYR